MSEHAPTLPDLLSRWHALAPEECVSFDATRFTLGMST